jgi:hypothetical protein
MFLRIDRLQIELPQPTKADANSAAALQELLGRRLSGQKPKLPENKLLQWDPQFSLARLEHCGFGWKFAALIPNPILLGSRSSNRISAPASIEVRAVRKG